MQRDVLSLQLMPGVCPERLTDSSHFTRKLVTALLMLSAVLVGFASQAQSDPVTPGEANSAMVSPTRLKAGYQTPIKGWVIHEGDTLLVGKASGPAQRFAFIYEIPTESTTEYVNGQAFYKYMGTTNGGKQAVVGSLSQSGQRRYIFKMCAALALGGTTYCADLDNAIISGEILPPAQYR
ncbi:hypothetical protein WBJ53_16745 [Spirosoma sp. SC4-14]|uniref:hypothetical protein n=1 Tax=Spirosoma sp. SC4-14 TaxID=3128900 RepID=UPI0030D180C6